MRFLMLLIGVLALSAEAQAQSQTAVFHACDVIGAVGRTEIKGVYNIRPKRGIIADGPNKGKRCLSGKIGKTLRAQIRGNVTPGSDVKLVYIFSESEDGASSKTIWVVR